MTVAKLPVFYNMKYTNDDGTMTPESQLYNDQLWQSLNDVVQQLRNGIELPNKTLAELTVYRDSLDVPVGTFWFNETTAELNFKATQAVYDASGVLVTPGTIRQVTSTAYI